MSKVVERAPQQVAAAANTMPAPADPMQLLSIAVSQGADIEKLEKLMDLNERWEANNARKAFDAAISDAKAEIKPIVKNGEVGYESKGRWIGYQHETLDGIASQIDPVLSKYGLSYRFRSRQEGGMVHITCVVSHRDGHSEETTLCGPPDQSGNKNGYQAVGSAATYLQRYTLKLALGLSATKDDDGTASGAPANEPERITTEQAELLRKLSVEAGDSPEYLLQAADLQRLEDMESDRFEGAVNHLKNRKAHREKLQAEQSAAAAGPTTSQPSAQGIFSGGAR